MAKKAESILPYDLGKCVICGAPYPEMHHAVYGCKRGNADADKLIVPLCHYHHMALHNEPSQKIAKMFKQIAEKTWISNTIKERSMSESEAIGAWIKRYGKNYL